MSQNKNMKLLHWTPEFTTSTWRIMYVTVYTVFWLDNAGSCWALQQWFLSLLPAAAHNSTFFTLTWLAAPLLTCIMLSSLRHSIFQFTTGYYEQVKENLGDRKAHDRNVERDTVGWFADLGNFLLVGQGLITFLFAYGSDVYTLYRIFLTFGMNASGSTDTSRFEDTLVIWVLPLVFICWSIFGPMIAAHVKDHARNVKYRKVVEQKLLNQHLKKTINFNDYDVASLEEEATPTLMPRIVPDLSQYARNLLSGNKP